MALVKRNNLRKKKGRPHPPFEMIWNFGAIRR